MALFRSLLCASACISFLLSDVRAFSSVAPPKKSCIVNEGDELTGGYFYAGRYRDEAIVVDHDGEIKAQFVGKGDDEPYTWRTVNFTCNGGTMLYQKQKSNWDGVIESSPCIVLPWPVSSSSSSSAAGDFHDMRCVDTSDAGTFTYHVSKVDDACVVQEMFYEYTELRALQICEEGEVDCPAAGLTEPLREHRAQLAAGRLTRIDDAGPVRCEPTSTY